MKKIRLATAFSGIGAPEHALDRLNIPYDIVFACDNGEIKLKESEEEIRKALDKMPTEEQKKEYIDGLYKKNRRTNFVQKSYFANYKIDTENYYQDVRFINGGQFKGKIDLFVGGSPCQSFSIGGYRKGFEDTRGTLFYQYARLVKEIQPKAFIYENVGGVLNHDEGRTWEIMQNVFSELGYDWKFKLMNAKDYGVPQSRNRIFVIGIRKDLKHKEYTFPEKEELKTFMKDYLESVTAKRYYPTTEGLKCIMKDKRLKKKFVQTYGETTAHQIQSGQFSPADNPKSNPFVPIELKTPGKIDEKHFLSDRHITYVMQTNNQKNYKIVPKIDCKVAATLVATMAKMHRMDNYVTTNGRLRRLTPREALRLMGFCDSFKIEVSDSQAYRQAGNSIVVDVMMKLILKLLDTGVFEEGQVTVE